MILGHLATLRSHATRLDSLESPIVADEPAVVQEESSRADTLAAVDGGFYNIRIRVESEERFFELEQPYRPADGQPTYPGRDVIVALKNEIMETWHGMYGEDAHAAGIAVWIDWHDSNGASPTDEPELIFAFEPE
jgi:hypothetical protein